MSRRCRCLSKIIRDWLAKIGRTLEYSMGKKAGWTPMRTWYETECRRRVAGRVVVVARGRQRGDGEGGGGGGE